MFPFWVGHIELAPPVEKSFLSLTVKHGLLDDGSKTATTAADASTSANGLVCVNGIKIIRSQRIKILLCVSDRKKYKKQKGSES